MLQVVCPFGDFLLHSSDLCVGLRFHLVHSSFLLMESRKWFFQCDRSIFVRFSCTLCHFHSVFHTMVSRLGDTDFLLMAAFHLTRLNFCFLQVANFRSQRSFALTVEVTLSDA